MGRAALFVVLLLCPLGLLAQSVQTGLDRPLTDLWRGLQVDSHHPDAAAMVGQIAKIAELQIGFEPFPQGRDGPLTPGPPEWIAVDHLTAREALDIAVARDPRYVWMEADGVVVLRPRAMWQAGPEHILHRPVGPMRIVGASPGEALEIVLNALTGERGHRQIATPLPGRITVSFERTTLMDALNKIAAAHGGLGWRFEHPAPPVGVERDWFSLSFSVGRRKTQVAMPASRVP